MVSLIVAYDENRVIGNQGSIPWRIPRDFQHFKETTLGHAVIMGRKTWESLPPKNRPLSGRKNIVLTRDFSFILAGADVANGWEEAISLAGALPIFVIGGNQIYEQALAQGIVSRVIASEVFGVHQGDSFFPQLDNTWNKKLLLKFDDFNIVEYNKVVNVKDDNGI